MLSVPFYVFWLLLYLCRNELDWRGMAAFIAIMAALVVGGLLPGSPRYLFEVGQALLDAVLVIVLLGRDVRICG